MNTCIRSLLPLVLVFTLASVAFGQKEEQSLEGFLSVLKPGMHVRLAPVGESGVWDIFAFPAEQKPQGYSAPVTMVGKDYFTLKAGNEMIHIPKHAIRRITTHRTSPLDITISLNFKRTPLQEAIEVIAEKIDATITIDADGLKFSGYTRNMPQTMTGENIPAKQLLAQIISQYQEMVLVKDGENFILTTRDFARKNQQTIIDLNSEANPKNE